MKRFYGFLIITILAALGVPSLAQEVASTIAFSSTRDNPDALPRINFHEIYFLDYLSDGTFANLQRMTENLDADFFPAMSPDGKGKIVFDSNRRRGPLERVNTSDLFLMNHDGTEVTFLTRGGSPTWSPPGPKGKASKMIAFHASASGNGQPIQTTPGAATEDSDIFVVNVDDLIENGAVPENITNDPTTIDDDPNWSADGQQIVFTRHDVNEPNHNNSLSTDIWVMNPDGSGKTQLTFSSEEERAPSFSPDGTLILFMCRKGSNGTFEVCVMNANGTGQARLTFNTVADLTPTWSPDGQQIVFHRPVPGEGPQVFVMTANGTGEQKVTGPPGLNHLVTSWGVIEKGPRKPD